jgi:uncharacterized protein DUF3179
MPNILNRLSAWTNARRTRVWLILLLSVLVVLVVVLTPIFLIMPFKAQTPRIMQVSYLMRRWSPWLTLIAAVLILTLTLGLWPASRWWSRIVLVILLLPALGATWLARQNHFEWMFKPLPNPAYAKMSDATFVNDDDRVMSVNIGGESVAYPVRIMAYHHLVGDTVGGTPVVTTY